MEQLAELLKMLDTVEDEHIDAAIRFVERIVLRVTAGTFPSTMALALFRIYQSHIAAGFSEEQAFELTKSAFGNFCRTTSKR